MQTTRPTITFFANDKNVITKIECTGFEKEDETLSEKVKRWWGRRANKHLQPDQNRAE